MTGDAVDLVMVDRQQLEELLGSVQELTERVGSLLDVVGAPPAAPDPAAPHPGFQRFRERQGGQRG